MNEVPFFSVIIPVYNKLPHLERSIFSVLNQSYKNFELILIDDASTDGSSEKLMEFNDPKISLFKRSTPGPGGYTARNLGITMAQYPWICFLDADDEWSLELLAVIKDVIVANKDIECLTWGWYNIDVNKIDLDITSKLYKNSPYLRFSIIDFFNQRNTLWTGAVAMKKELLIRAGCFPENGYTRGGDVDTWIRCLWHSKANMWINRTLSFYYLDSVNMVTKLVQRDTNHAFSPFVNGLLNGSNDKKLISAIRNFQNKRIYSTIRGQYIDRHPPDYKLMKKMNYSSDYLLLIGKLMYNRVKYLCKYSIHSIAGKVNRT